MSRLESLANILWWWWGGGGAEGGGPGHPVWPLAWGNSSGPPWLTAPREEKATSVGGPDVCFRRKCTALSSLCLCRYFSCCIKGFMGAEPTGRWSPGLPYSPPGP